MTSRISLFKATQTHIFKYALYSSLRVAIMRFKYAIGTTGFTMILLVPTRILAVFDHRFTMTFVTSMYFIFQEL